MGRASRKKKSSRPGDNGPLIKASLVLPSNLSLEEQLLTLQLVRQMSTRCRIHRENGMRPIIEAWCTPRQMHDFDNFSRYVFDTKRRDEGVDMDEVKRVFDEQTKGQSDDPFILPRDVQRLSIVAAANGMHMVAMDSPAYRPDEELRKLGQTMCDLAPKIWPEVTNNIDLYRSTFIPSFVMGYHMAVKQLMLHSSEEQKKFTDIVTDDSFLGNGPRAVLVFTEIIKDRMKAWGVESIQELYEKEQLYGK
jgi:hypothetical protein